MKDEVQLAAVPAMAKRSMRKGAVSVPPATAPNGALNLAGKAALIKDVLGLDAGLNIAAAIRKASSEVGCESEGNLNELADAVLLELMPM